MSDNTSTSREVDLEGEIRRLRAEIKGLEKHTKALEEQIKDTTEMQEEALVEVESLRQQRAILKALVEERTKAGCEASCSSLDEICRLTLTATALISSIRVKLAALRREVSEAREKTNSPNKK